MIEESPPRVALQVDGVDCRCRPALADELARVYAQGRWVFEEIQRQPGVRFFQGRRPVVVGRIGGVPAVVKRLHHGGLLAPLTGDRFLTPKRALINLSAVDALNARGLTTPDVLFAAWRRRGAVVRMELGFELVEGGEDAAAVVFGGRTHSVIDVEGVIEEVGRTVAALHRAGVYHRDLNLRNFLVTPPGKVMILDVDKARVGTRPPGLLARHRNLRRLEGSMRKLGHGLVPPARLEELIARLRAAYRAASHAG